MGRIDIVSCSCLAVLCDDGKGNGDEVVSGRDEWAEFRSMEREEL